MYKKSKLRKKYTSAHVNQYINYITNNHSVIFIYKQNVCTVVKRFKIPKTKLTININNYSLHRHFFK